MFVSAPSVNRSGCLPALVEGTRMDTAPDGRHLGSPGRVAQIAPWPIATLEM